MINFREALKAIVANGRNSKHCILTALSSSMGSLSSSSSSYSSSSLASSSPLPPSLSSPRLWVLSFLVTYCRLMVIRGGSALVSSTSVFGMKARDRLMGRGREIGGGGGRRRACYSSVQSRPLSPQPPPTVVEATRPPRSSSSSPPSLWWSTLSVWLPPLFWSSSSSSSSSSCTQSRSSFFSHARTLCPSVRRTPLLPSLPPSVHLTAAAAAIAAAAVSVVVSGVRDCSSSSNRRLLFSLLLQRLCLARTSVVQRTPLSGGTQLIAITLIGVPEF